MRSVREIGRHGVYGAVHSSSTAGFGSSTGCTQKLSWTRITFIALHPCPMLLEFCMALYELWVPWEPVIADTAPKVPPMYVVVGSGRGISK